VRLLITSSRMTFALDAIRKLGERGHEVYASDSYEDSPMADGITWDGQPIPGLPADDESYLAELTGTG
jgi:hypothetical protein